MSSEPQSAGALMGPSFMQQMLARVREREEWERQHPELAAAWTEALKEDHERTTRLERESLLESARSRLPEQLAAMDVPLDAVHALKRLSENDHLKAARAFWSAPVLEKRFLLLLGTVGTGKTVAAAWLLGEALAKARTVQRPTGGEERRAEPAVFVRASTFSRLSAYRVEDREWFEQMCRCGLLVLDDLAAEQLSPVAAAMLDELLDRRYGARLKTVITSNLEKDAFLLRVGERAKDRMRAFAIASQSKGKSLRRREGV